MSNVVNFLKEAAERNPDRTALVVPGDAEGGIISYSELWDQIDRFSTSLLKRGLAPGDRVVIMIPMSVKLYVAMLGVIKMGGVAVFADPWVKMSQIIEFCTFASPKGFIGIPKSHFLRLYNSFLRNIPLTVSTGIKACGILAGNSFEDMLKENRSSEVYSVESEDSALITFTTGSSGIPKGANRTHGFLTAQKNALDREFPIEDSDIDMPMFPVFALRNLANGITSVIPDMDFKSVAKVEGKRILNQIEKYKVNTITASPPFFDNLSEVFYSVIRLRRILTGGAPVRDSQLESWRVSFSETEIQIVYGSTEAEPVSHISMEERLNHSSKTGFCTGKPTDLVKTKIIRTIKGSIDSELSLDDITLQKGEIGELIVSGDHVCRDYYNNPVAVKENKIIDKEGKLWHRMGDTGYFDEEGRFYLVGRVHSTVFRNGITMHPQLIEKTARGNGKGIINIAALGIRDKELGEKVVIVVESKEETQVIKDAIRERMKKTDMVYDEIIIQRALLPLDPRHNSKIDYEKLRNMIT